MKPLQQKVITILAEQLPMVMQQEIRDKLNDKTRASTVFKVVGNNGSLKAVCSTILKIANADTPEYIFSRLNEMFAYSNNLSLIQERLREEFSGTISEFVKAHPFISVAQVEKAAKVPTTTLAAMIGKAKRPMAYKHIAPIMLVLNQYGMEL
jgi:hypothetical protein